MSLRKVLENTEISEQMSGAAIAKELGISRQAVSNTLKRAMKKAYIEARKIDKSSPFEAAVILSQIFDQGEDDIKKFFKLFPPDIRKEIEADAREKLGWK